MCTATNAAGVTLNVDGLGAKPIQAPISTGVPAGALVAFTPYRVTYVNGSNAFILQQFFGQPLLVPVAGCITYFGATVPNSNFAFPVGQAISRTTYAALFAIIGTTYGGGDGSTTFNLPDVRGRIPLPLDNLGGVTANRLSTNVTGSLASVRHTLGGAGGEDAHTVTTGEMPSHGHAVTDPTHVHNSSNTSWAKDSHQSAGTGGPKNSIDDGGAALITAAAATGISIQNTGGGGAHNNCMPSIMVSMIMRII